VRGRRSFVRDDLRGVQVGYLGPCRWGFMSWKVLGEEEKQDQLEASFYVQILGNGSRE
jgi:hypothetical protein